MDIKQCIIGYLISTLGGAVILWLVIDKLGCWYITGKAKKRSDKPLTLPLGIIERILYTTAFIIGAEEWIAVWLALKVLSVLINKGKESERNRFNLLLIGNALSIIFGFIGAWISFGNITYLIEKL
jgi:hypothetical protein